MDLTDRISFSKSFDLAGQNKVFKDPGQVYIAKTINIGLVMDGASSEITLRKSHFPAEFLREIFI